MKLHKLLSVLLAAFLVAGATGASAHGRRAHVGVYFGPSVYWGPGWGAPFYPYPYYPPPPVVVMPPPAPPPVYIEQNEAPVQGGQPYWHYCKSAQGYYPYVKECPDGWQKVLPQPEK